MKLIEGDLLEGDWDVAMHCCNCHCVMGSGVAYFLQKKWPIVSKEDDKTKGVDADKKLGLFTLAEISSNRFVVNLYAQRGIGNNGDPLDRNVRYDDLYDSVYRSLTLLKQSNVEFKLRTVTVGIPYLMGCCRAGGTWEIVDAILRDIESKIEGVEFVVYRLENFESTANSSINISK